MRRGQWLRQGGFLYLTTGANGAGKTLFTLRDVRTLQLETKRDVYFYGFTAKQALLDFGWKPFDPERWQELPDGAILVVDECQKVMPVRGQGRPPRWIEDIAEVHRKRGFDFFLITQSPMNIDAFIRRIIGSPGWHRHFKSSPMAELSNELKWTAVKTNPEVPNSGASGEVTQRKFDKEVFEWYESASQHTARRKIPAIVWKAIFGAVLALGLVAYAVWRLTQPAHSSAKPAAEARAVQTAQTPAGPVSQAPAAHMQTASEYVESFRPRLAGLPHTAPRYDALTSPKQAPYPAACIAGENRRLRKDECRCYTQQGTKLAVPDGICRQIVDDGYFREDLPPASLVAERGPDSDLVSRPQGRGLGYGGEAPHASGTSADGPYVGIMGQTPGGRAGPQAAGAGGARSAP